MLKLEPLGTAPQFEKQTPDTGLEFFKTLSKKEDFVEEFSGLTLLFEDNKVFVQYDDQDIDGRSSYLCFKFWIPGTWKELKGEINDSKSCA